MADAVITTSIQNTRAAAMVLDHAERTGLPDPIGVSAGREYDNDVSRNSPNIRFQFKTAEDLQAWATHLGVDVVSHSTLASAYSMRQLAQVWHHNAVAEWMDVTIALPAATEHPARPVGVVP